MATRATATWFFVSHIGTPGLDRKTVETAADRISSTALSAGPGVIGETMWGDNAPEGRDEIVCHEVPRGRSMFIGPCY